MNGHKPVRTRFGFDVLTDDRDALGLRGRYYYEKEITEILVAEIRPGETAVDVGAMIGYHTLAMARAVGPAGRVFAFEPLPSNYKLLTANLELNGITNAVAVVAAASAESGGATLYMSGKNVADNSIFPANETRASIEIKTWALDDYFGHGRTRVGFLKIDTQGGEAKVLAGAGKILLNPGLRMVVEYYPKGLELAGSSGRELFLAISEAGFEVFEVNKRGKEPLPATEQSLGSRYSAARGNHCNLFCRGR